MPFQPVANCVSMRVNGVMGSIPVENLYNVGTTAELTEELAETLFENLVADLTILVGVQVDDYSIPSITVTDEREEDGPQFTFPILPSGLSGTSTSTPLPFQTAALISWGTAKRGQSFRGRTYLGGFGETGSAGRTIESTVVTALEDFRDAMVERAYYVVVSRMHEGSLREEGIVTPLTSGLVHTTWRTQRRRALASD